VLYRRVRGVGVFDLQALVRQLPAWTILTLTRVILINVSGAECTPAAINIALVTEWICVAEAFAATSAE
jgi:hypothetical protein